MTVPSLLPLLLSCSFRVGHCADDSVAAAARLHYGADDAIGLSAAAPLNGGADSTVGLGLSAAAPLDGGADSTIGLSAEARVDDLACSLYSVVGSFVAHLHRWHAISVSLPPLTLSPSPFWSSARLLRPPSGRPSRVVS